MASNSAAQPGAGGTDVFISYKREERGDVERIAERLRGLGLNVWFDTKLASGMSFDEEINREVRGAKCVLVCWSPGAMASDWVRAEASIGRGRDVLAAVMLKPTDLFPPFNLIHSEDLSTWRGEDMHRGWLNTLARIGDLCGRPDIADRARRFVAAGDSPPPPPRTAPAPSAAAPDAPAKSGGIGGVIVAGVALVLAAAGGFWWLNRGGPAPTDQTGAAPPPSVAETGAPPISAPPTAGTAGPGAPPPPTVVERPVEPSPLSCLDAAVAVKVSPGEAQRLCGALANQPEQGPLQCYQRLMQGGVSWGGGTRWIEANAIRLCAGAARPAQRIGCFEEALKGGLAWDAAIGRCTTGAGGGAEAPAAEDAPVVRTGEGRIRPSFLFDLDTDREIEGGGDIWFQARSETDQALGPPMRSTNNTALLRQDRPPTRTQCRTARFTGERLDVINPRSQWLCVRTTEGRLAAVQVVGTYQYPEPVQIRFTLWER
jgi:hypothetical protein